MELLIQQLVNGLAVGSIYALIALGYTMVYGTIKLINFAHGDVYMMGAFIGYFAVMVLKLNVFLALLLAMVACAILGVVIERVAYKPLRKSTRVAALITAIGVSYLLENAMSYFFGAESRPFPSDFGTETFTLFGDVSVNGKQILIFGITVLLMALLQFIVRYTKMGKAMRAVAVDEQAAQLMGIDVDGVISFTFALGSALAGIAGVLVGVYYNTISTTMGITVGLKAFVAAVLGGIGSIPGAMVGGYLIGLLETMVSFFGYSPYRDGVVYFLLFIILIVLPAGLFGKNVREKV
ncbi:MULTISPECIES: branched-chain amino acid ABC transporter permease [Granulicatella]|jgi:high-affinity branched-chain amino acid ABC superfamily ATP binding cassette transporter, permease protein livH|uniref:branched-chain amino acid ABC transporter permease n=1 Tax=Granulicatella TaxID=117563 RepID=UPI0008A2F569|nr:MULTISPECIES: branched-chain amino acid ABC transporter permease [Granulicatella]MCT2160428.1 branched-chain amino acid ABC transporter permease [Granulicatella adiacens]OFT02468.1 ABC transporter permease [Granulicatella sp. HMSC31F03]UXY41318.1 branched-chain amino acid ABC transporter permease [Granulicatella adiacens]